MDEADLCAVCRDALRLPSVLPCGHVFCAGCLRRMVEAKTALTCPTCRHPFDALPRPCILLGRLLDAGRRRAARAAAAATYDERVRAISTAFI